MPAGGDALLLRGCDVPGYRPDAGRVGGDGECPVDEGAHVVAREVGAGSSRPLLAGRASDGFSRMLAGRASDGRDRKPRWRKNPTPRTPRSQAEAWERT